MFLEKKLTSRFEDTNGMLVWAILWNFDMWGYQEAAHLRKSKRFLRNLIYQEENEIDTDEDCRPVGAITEAVLLGVEKSQNGRLAVL